LKKYLTELIGTFALVFFGTGAIVVNEFHPGLLGHLGISLVFGLIVMTVIYSIGDVSGAHINPAVSFAFFLAKKICLKDTVFYTISQLVGAALASLLLRSFFRGSDSLGATIPTLDPLAAFILEVIISFYLMFVILHVATGSQEKGLMAGVAVGGTVLISSLFAGPLTGASMNPARTFGPALINLDLKYLWLYFISTYLGMSLAVISCLLIRNNKC